MVDNVNEMEVADYNILHNILAAFYRMWKLKLVIVFATAIGVLLSIAYLTYKGEEKVYYSSATIYSAVYGSYTETISGVTIMNTYASVLNSTRVCERAASELAEYGISSAELMAMVSEGKITLSGASTESKKYGYRLLLRTTLNSPEHVVVITNAMATAYISEINELLGDDILQVFDEARMSYSSAASSKLITIAIFAGVAFVLSAGIIFVKEFFSSKVYLVSQCEKDKDLILGLLPYTK